MQVESLILIFNNNDYLFHQSYREKYVAYCYWKTSLRLNNCVFLAKINHRMGVVCFHLMFSISHDEHVESGGCWSCRVHFREAIHPLGVGLSDRAVSCQVWTKFRGGRCTVHYIPLATCTFRIFGTDQTTQLPFLLRRHTEYVLISNIEPFVKLCSMIDTFDMASIVLLTSLKL